MTGDVGEQMLAALDPWADFEALCGLGGRLCGTSSEVEARAYLTERLRAIAAHRGGRFAAIEHRYTGWRARSFALAVEQTGRTHDGFVLLRSPATGARGLSAEVIDLGRGARADFEAAGAAIAGRIALVRHEFMFDLDHIHRSRKYQWAAEFEAAAFLIAGGEDQIGAVAGGIGFGDDPPIPAAGISAQAAADLTGANEPFPRISLTIETEEAPAQTQSLMLEWPGQTSDWVVVSAHLDGHAPGQSAIDNATGMAASIAAVEAVAARTEAPRRGLRLCLFSIEEWGLLGSRDHIASLSAEAREAIALNINLDSVAGAPRLSALYSEFPLLAEFLATTAASCGIALDLHPPLVRNSDHYSFAAAGIPACRLLAGFEMPRSNMRHVLTAADTIDKVTPEELRRAAELTARLAHRACTADELKLR